MSRKRNTKNAKTLLNLFSHRVNEKILNSKPKGESKNLEKKIYWRFEQNSFVRVEREVVLKLGNVFTGRKVMWRKAKSWENFGSSLTLLAFYMSFNTVYSAFHLLIIILKLPGQPREEPATAWHISCLKNLECYLKNCGSRFTVEMLCQTQ